MTENERISIGKFAIEQTTENGKLWIYVRFHSSGQRWKPSFADLWRILEALAICEEIKYPSRNGYAGGMRVWEFVEAACEVARRGGSYEELARLFNIPERTKDGVIVRTNGARLPTLPLFANQDPDEEDPDEEWQRRDPRSALTVWLSPFDKVKAERPGEIDWDNAAKDNDDE
jgi:hypothetical protein